MKNTDNLGLLLPDQDDSYNVDDFNANSINIDKAITTLKSEIANRMKMKTVKLDYTDWSDTYGIYDTTMCLTMDNILFVEIKSFGFTNLSAGKSISVKLKTSGLNKIRNAFGGIPMLDSVSNIAMKEIHVCTGVDMNSNIGTNPPSLVENSLVLYNGSVELVCQNVSSGTASNVYMSTPFKGCCIIDGLKA